MVRRWQASEKPRRRNRGEFAMALVQAYGDFEGCARRIFDVADRSEHSVVVMGSWFLSMGERARSGFLCRRNRVLVLSVGRCDRCVERLPQSGGCRLRVGGMTCGDEMTVKVMSCLFRSIDVANSEADSRVRKVSMTTMRPPQHGQAFHSPSSLPPSALSPSSQSGAGSGAPSS